MPLGEICPPKEIAKLILEELPTYITKFVEQENLPAMIDKYNLPVTCPMVSHSDGNKDCLPITTCTKQPCTPIKQRCVLLCVTYCTMFFIDYEGNAK